MLERLDWQRDGVDWPNRQASRFIRAGGLNWHVQTMGRGPTLLLLHGTGAATHSWRDLLPLLARHFSVIAPDLPGHGFTEHAIGEGMSLPGMARLVSELLAKAGVAPAFAVGHSAGAAILARMAIDDRLDARAIVSLNGAFLPFTGMLRVFSPVAKFLASTSLAARFAASRAHDDAAVKRLFASTGSILDVRAIELYARLMRSPGHVAGALAMMARWDLDRLLRDLPALTAPVLLVAGSNDRTVPPQQADAVAAMVARARVETWSGLGHLAHEERPRLAAAAIVRFLRQSSACA